MSLIYHFIYLFFTFTLKATIVILLYPKLTQREVFIELTNIRCVFTRIELETDST